MVAVAFDLQLLLEFRQIVFGIVGESDHVRVALEFEVVDLVQLAVLVEAVRLERAFVELLHLRVQAIVVEGVGTGGFVLDVQVHELRAQSHHLVDAADQVVCHLVAESQPFAHMLVQCDGALPAPFAFAAFQLDFVVLLLIETGRLAAHLHGGVRRFFTVAEFAGYRPLFVADLQQTVDLVPVGAHGRVIIHGILVDFAPTVSVPSDLLPRETVRYMVSTPLSSYTLYSESLSRRCAPSSPCVALFLTFSCFPCDCAADLSAVEPLSAAFPQATQENVVTTVAMIATHLNMALRPHGRLPIVIRPFLSMLSMLSTLSLMIPSVRKFHAAVRRIRPTLRPVS